MKLFSLPFFIQVWGTIGFAIFTLSPAHALEEWWKERMPAITVYGGLNRPHYSSHGPSYDDLDTRGRVGTTFGASLEVPVSAHTALEAAFFSNGIGVRETERASGVSYSAGYRTKELALLVRHELLIPSGWEIDIGAGGFREWVPDTSEISDTTDATAIPNGEYPLDREEYMDYDQGLRLSVRARFPYDPGVEPFIQADYRLGLKNLNQLPGNRDHSRIFLLLAGLRFELL